MMIPHLHLQGTPANIIVGSHVWIEDPEEAWIGGYISKINETDAEVETTDGKKVCTLSVTCFLFYSIYISPLFDDLFNLRNIGRFAADFSR